MFLKDSWPVRIPGDLRPAIEQIARDEYIEPAQVVRRLVRTALNERAIAAGKRDQSNAA
jgi:hypothetical protein